MSGTLLEKIHLVCDVQWNTDLFELCSHANGDNEEQGPENYSFHTWCEKK